MHPPAARIAALLHEAGETHHVVYRIVDGDDPDWASWYADWLIDLSELPQILGAAPVRSELVWLLVQLDRDYAAQRPGDPGRTGTPSGSSPASAADPDPGQEGTGAAAGYVAGSNA